MKKMVLHGPRQLLEYIINVSSHDNFLNTTFALTPLCNVGIRCVAVCTNISARSCTPGCRERLMPSVYRAAHDQQALSQDDEQICMDICKLCSVVGESGVDFIASGKGELIKLCKFYSSFYSVNLKCCVGDFRLLGKPVRR